MALCGKREGLMSHTSQYKALHRQINKRRDRLRYLAGTPQEAARLFAEIGHPVHGATLDRWIRIFPKGDWWSEGGKQHKKGTGLAYKHRTLPRPVSNAPPEGYEEAKALGAAARAEREAREAYWRNYYADIRAKQAAARKQGLGRGQVPDADD